LLALMVVWDYPCESKSSPAHYSKHPQPMVGVFFYMENQSIFIAGICILNPLNIKIDSNYKEIKLI
ncbi:hypothetical protein CAT39_00005, partial [Acinetobacter baumannii]|uniref:hypothetical protein n=1 Tax=Acinetobacter baumannii TaxID=470 RepID=UPI000B6F56F6